MELYKLSIEKIHILFILKTEDDIVRLEAILQSDKATRELLYSALRRDYRPITSRSKMVSK